MAKITCGVCGGIFKSSKMRGAKDGFVCEECYKAAGFPASISVSLIPISVLKEQIKSTDGLSVVKRFKQQGGEELQANLDFKVPKVVSNTNTSSPGDNVPKCPRCGSTSISANKKGFGIGKAVVGAAIAGPLGLMAGNIGAKKVRVTCLNCGHQWMRG